MTRSTTKLSQHYKMIIVPVCPLQIETDFQDCDKKQSALAKSNGQRLD